MTSSASDQFCWLGRLGRGAVMAAVLAVATAASAADAAPGGSPFRFVEQPKDGTLTLYEADRPVLVYNFTDRLKPGLPADRKRACYLHPIYGLDGETLTQDFPPEGHFHHRGLCWAWAEVRVQGQLSDPWDLRHIRARFSKWTERRADPDTATLAAEDDWVLDGTQVVATEVVCLRVHKATDVGRAIDFQWRIEPKVAPLEIGGRKKAGYGGLLFRFPSLKQTVITTDQGPQPKDANLKPCVWADLSSQFGEDDKRSGAAIFLHPQHPGMSVGWTLRNYGLLNPAFPGTASIALTPGKPLVLQYRLWLHRADAVAGGVRQAYEAYRKELGQAATKSEKWGQSAVSH